MREQMIRIDWPGGEKHVTQALTDKILASPSGEFTLVTSDGQTQHAYSVLLKETLFQIIDQSSPQEHRGIYAAQVVSSTPYGLAKGLNCDKCVFPRYFDDIFDGKSKALIQVVRTRFDCKHITSLRAQQLFDACLRYFRDIQGHSIVSIADKWPKDGDLTDNYRMFKQARQSICASEPHIPDYYADWLAAEQTWTGRQAQRFGFSDVRVTELDTAVLALFFNDPR